MFPTYTLTNASGMEVQLTSYGCTVLSLKVPDREGRMADVVLGFSELERYPKESPHFGCVVGRFGNRIAGGRFTLDGEEYVLACNNFPGGVPCHLHGGVVGFDKFVWDSEPVQKTGATGIHFSRISPDGEEGYPGNLTLNVTYWWTDRGELQMEYEATTDRATILNLTHHSYFNLKGEGRGDVLDHQIQINADRFVPVGADLIPLGVLRSVEGTVLDFRKPAFMGGSIDDPKEEQVILARGYDHCWVLGEDSRELRVAARVLEAESGRTLEVLTTEPGLQFYSGNFLDGTLIGKSGQPYLFRGGFCLEPQRFPDSPNQPDFPSTVLRPGETYTSTTIYRFGLA